MRPPAIEATIVPQPAPIALEDYTTDGREHTIVLDPAAQRAKILPPLPLPACKLLRQHTVEHIRFRSSSNDGPYEQHRLRFVDLAKMRLHNRARGAVKLNLQPRCQLRALLEARVAEGTRRGGVSWLA